MVKLKSCRRLILLGVTIIDGTGAEPREDMAITLEGATIVAIQPISQIRPSKEAEVIDLEGLFALPGLIDCHVHLRGISEYTQGFSDVLEPTRVRAMRSVAHAHQILRWGFTTVRDISWNGLYLKRVINEGAIIGPSIVACGPGLSRTGGHGDYHLLPPDVTRDRHPTAILCDGEDEIRKASRMLIREGADFIKLWVSGGGNWEKERVEDEHYSVEEVKMAVREAKMIGGTRVAAHCENLRSIRVAVESEVNTIEHGEKLNEEVAEKMAENGVVLVPTVHLLTECVRTEMPELSQPQIDAKIAGYRANLDLARHKGVKIALGSDSMTGGYDSMLELKALVDMGLSPLEGITSATKIGAEALGIEKTVGTIVEGKDADLLVVDGDPREDIGVLLDRDRLRVVVRKGHIHFLQ